MTRAPFLWEIRQDVTVLTVNKDDNTMPIRAEIFTHQCNQIKIGTDADQAKQLSLSRNSRDQSA
jgi:hypothetical protein